MFEAETLTLAQAVLETCRARNWGLATAESCTGGLVAGALTAIAGSSDVVERGFVTYSNEAKSELLGVPPEIITAHGSVSAETAAAMAQGIFDDARLGQIGNKIRELGQHEKASLQKAEANLASSGTMYSFA